MSEQTEGHATECECQDCVIDRLVASAPVPTPEQAARIARMLRLSERRREDDQK